MKKLLIAGYECLFMFDKIITTSKIPFLYCFKKKKYDHNYY